MSIYVQSKLWEHSTQKGSSLLLLLAIADHADDNGRAYPSIDRLASKTRLSRRQVQALSSDLQNSGDLVVEENCGPNGCNIYHIVINGVATTRYSGGAKIARVQSSDARLHPPTREGGAIQRRQTAPKPSLSINKEPSGFEEFWIAYPKKMAKQAARTAWKKVNVSLDVIRASLEKFKLTPDWTKEDGKFIPYPSTWLNGRRWEDEISVPKKKVVSCL